MNTRGIALKVLAAVERDGAYSALALNNAIKENKLNNLDSSFVSALVYGVIERKLTLDYIIGQYSKIPLRKIEFKTKLILRMGILQLVFMDKIPNSAAVNESVKLAKRNGLIKSSGFINGLLRSVTRAEVKYTLPDRDKDLSYYLSIKYSCPCEIVKLWASSYGAELTEALLGSVFGRPRLTAAVNTLICTPDELISELESEGVKAYKSEIDANAVLLENTGSIENLSAYKNGMFYIQDTASRLCVKALDPKPGEVIADVCSAPGGKAFTSAQYMKNEGVIYAFDIYEHKLRLIEKTAERLRINIIKTALRDAEKDESFTGKADRVLCDVPCSGLGILGRKPEIRYKPDLLDPALPELQYRILCNSARLVKVGGVLIYSTCTLNSAENRENAERFLAEHGGFEPVPLDLGVPRLIDEPENMMTLFPHFHPADGFFISAFRKVR